jgi:hypothetical protein
MVILICTWVLSDTPIPQSMSSGGCSLIQGGMVGSDIPAGAAGVDLQPIKAAAKHNARITTVIFFIKTPYQIPDTS